MPSGTDAIAKDILLTAPRARVWRALTDSTQFGAWFGVVFHGPFVAGTSIDGTLTIPGYEHLTFAFAIETIEPETRFAFRWHPYAIDPAYDYSAEPTTLCTFTLEDADGGILLRVVESGFDAIPAHRRVKAFESNTGGWKSQLENIAKYLTPIR
jgi:uncharacterized protein YndB with AHSA1/START domain